MTATNGKVIIAGLPANDPEYAIHVSLIDRAGGATKAAAELRI